MALHMQFHHYLVWQREEWTKKVLCWVMFSSGHFLANNGFIWNTDRTVHIHYQYYGPYGIFDWFGNCIYTYDDSQSNLRTLSTLWFNTFDNVHVTIPFWGLCQQSKSYIPNLTFVNKLLPMMEMLHSNRPTGSTFSKIESILPFCKLHLWFSYHLRHLWFSNN